MSERSEASSEYNNMPQNNNSSENGGGLSLEILQQPLQVFWKDEGGRSNYLTASVAVRGVERYGKVAIVPSLMYENYAEVEDAEDILKVLSVEPKSVSRSGQRVTVKFRIEKVSRRKDGRKFRLSLDCDKEGALPERACTSPVMVLSKRKSQASVSGSNSGGYRSPGSTNGRKTSGGVKRKNPPSQRRSSLPVTKLEHQQQSQQPHLLQAHNQAAHQTQVVPLDALRAAMSSMESKIAALTDRVAYLEKENKRQAIALAESFRAPEPEPVSSPSTHVFEEELCEFDIEGTHNGIAFNFGLPSAMGSPSDF